MGICQKINNFVSTLIIMLAAMWFVLIVFINDRSSDPRVIRNLLEMKQKWIKMAT